jgi:hypothetical protein
MVETMRVDECNVYFPKSKVSLSHPAQNDKYSLHEPI